VFHIAMPTSDVSFLTIVVGLDSRILYIAFMKVEKSSYLKIRMDWLYSIFIAFLIAIIVRYLWLLWQLLRGRDPGAPDPEKVSSGL
jgi:TRAP-type C4-dicarboxylate transport system permease small subunit